MRLTQFLGTGVNIHFVTCLSIAHLEESDVGQRLGTWIVHLNGSHIVLLIGNLKGMLKVLVIEEVADDEGCAMALHHPCEVLQSHTDVGALALRMKIEHLADDVENVLAALLGRDVFLYSVGEEDDTYLIVVLNGTEGQGGCNLGSHVALHLPCGTEVERATYVDQQHHGKLALLLEHLDKGTMETGGHIPVDVSHVVAILVLPHLGEGHTPALEGRVILACKDILAETASLYLDLAYFL